MSLVEVGVPPGWCRRKVGQPQVVFDFTIAHGKIVGIELLADPASLAEMDLVIDN